MPSDVRKKALLYDLAVFASILVLITCQLIKLGDEPGLYLDAINPDYIGVQLLFPQVMETKWQIAWPWLCQVYHGNVGMVITMVSVMLTGRTSMLQYHITYGVVAAIAVFLTYKVLTHRRVGINRRWAWLGSVLLITWPSLLTIVITQFYMCLFGSICMLVGALLLLDWLDDTSSQKRLALCYLSFGVSFYSYFNFLFLAPTLVLATIYVMKQDGVPLGHIMQPLVAYTCGCGLYFVGWTQIALVAHGVGMSMVRKLALLLAVYCLLALVYVGFSPTKKHRMALLVACAVCLCVWAVLVLPSVKIAAAGLDVVEDTTIGQKLAAVPQDYSLILSGKLAEMLIYGTSVTYLNNHLLLFLVVVMVVTFACERICRHSDIKWKVPVATILIFMCCCVPLGTRMQPQHYVPLLFVTYIGLCFCAKAIFGCLASTGSARLARIVARKGELIVAVSAFVLCANLFNSARVINAIQVSGGEHYWADEMTELADDALDGRDQGVREVYAFKDWGFFTGFNYLTMNRVPYLTDVNEDALRQQYAEGNDIVICYWEAEDSPSYISLCDSIDDGTGRVETREWKDGNGKVEFYEIALRHGAEGDESAQA